MGLLRYNDSMEVATKPSYRLRDLDKLLDVTDTQYVLRVKDLPDGERPREKLLATGPQTLDLAELTAIIWGVGTRKEDVLAMARRTLKEYGEKAITSELKPQQLADVADIPLAKACQLVASFELGRRFYATTHGGQPVYIRTAHQAYEYLRSIGGASKEQLRGLYLGSRHQIVRDEVISIGSLTSNIVHPREVFQPAIEHNAVALIIAHNHPSGALDPTTADVEVTRQLRAAGEILGIDLLDHLIITTTAYKSVMEEIL